MRPSREGWLCATPKDFEKFLAATRSTSVGRSLSPERELQQMTKSNTALNRFGRPLWDPLRKQVLCPADHVTVRRRHTEYIGLGFAAVACDFCSLLQPLNKDDHGSVKCNTWYHCDKCNMDICGHCALEMQRDAKCHVPCMHCTTCGQFMAVEDGLLHRCATKLKSTTSPDILGKSLPTATSAITSVRKRLRAEFDTPPADAQLSWTVQVTGLPASMDEAKISETFGVEAPLMYALRTQAPDGTQTLEVKTRTRVVAESFAFRVRSTRLSGAAVRCTDPRRLSD